jgi:steroid 5-alpha reductase family enzyme
MNKNRSIKGIIISLSITALTVLVGSAGSGQFAGFPLFMICATVIFFIHWIAFIPSYLFRTEHYFDITGSISYISAFACAWFLSPVQLPRNILLALLVSIWAIRLGSFLLLRVKRIGKDVRFDQLKHDFLAFAMTWTLSGLWVLLTSAAALAAMTNKKAEELDTFALIGALVWILGFSIEVIADTQKSRFRRNPENIGKFITTGLWRLSRHPNYFGEILLWIGIALIAFPALTGWQYVTLVSPVFVWFLLTKVSGIPLLESKAETNWGDTVEYHAYKESTPMLIPKPKV